MPAKRKLNRETSGIGTQESPYSKRSRKSKPNQTEIAENILDALKSYQDSNGNSVYSTFTRAPSKRHCPEYHEVVQEPIDMTRIAQRLRADEYRDIEALTADIDLLVSNSKKFYEENSKEYKDANALWELYIDTKTQFFSKDKSEEQTQPDSLQARLEQLYNALLAETDEEERGITEMFMVLPDQNVYPDYYKKIKDPIDLTMISNKIQNKEYKSVPEWERDIKQLIKNAKTYNEPNSKIYNDAVSLRNALNELLVDVDKSEKQEVGTKTSARLKQRYSAKFDVDTGLKRQDAVDFPESSVRSNRGSPLLQASITDSSLKGKELLQSKYYNEIVNYRNNLGHSISDVFVRLPNRHHYPAYYEEITNPISLKAIRRTILGKKYKTISQLAEDFRLLFKNAMQYNKEGSQIFINAETLLNFMESKLEAYEEQEVGLEASDGESGSNSGSDEGQDDDEEEESEEEDEEKTSSVEGKKVRKRRSDFGVSKKHKGIQVFRDRLRLLYQTVLDSVDGDRSMITLFMEKPSRKDYPDYYKLILEPIDMRMIDRKIRQDKYTNVTSLVEDFHLMFTNARHYNEPGSEVYQDADRLQEILRLKQEELPPLSAEEMGLLSGKCDGNKPKVDPLLKNMEEIYQRVRNCRDVTGREICEIFNRLPSKQELPDYYQVIKKPMDMDRISQKLIANSYASMSEFMTDMLMMFDNACNYNEPGSVIYKDALILQKLAVDTHNELVGISQPPDVQKFVQEILTNLYVSVVNHQDEHGRCFSDSLITLPIQAGPKPPDANTGEAMETTDSVEQAQTIQTPKDGEMSLDVIKRNLHNKRYRRLDVFQDHMFQLFENARKGNRTDCEVYEDSVELQKFFIRIRDELCKNGEILMSPALTYTLKTLQGEIDAEKQEKLPAEALEDEQGRDEGEEMREKVRQSVSSDDMEYKGVAYQPGDFVYVENTTDPNELPHIVCIEKLYQEEDGEQWMFGVWMYRPQDTYHLASRKFLQKEVFKSDYYNTVPMAKIRGKCFVMMVKDYFKNEPVGYSEDDVFVCVSRYTSRIKSFKRIKLLSLPPNNTKIVPREKPLVPIHVSSVYSSDPKKVQNEVTLMDIHGPLVTDGLPWPTDVIDKERVNITIENNLVENKLTVQQTFYLQYNLNNLTLKVGDCVYVRQQVTDQRLKISRIESMWSDANHQMWFQGSWFAIPGETEHEPTRMFYKNEVFLLSFNTPSGDEATASMPPPTPLSWVAGVCAVMSVREVAQCRPSEIQEMHIHTCESRYLAADKIIKKMKGALKKPAVNHRVVDDEYFYFKKPLELEKVVSPLLVTAVRQELIEREEEMKREQEESKMKIQQSQPGQNMLVGQAYPNPMNPMQPTVQRPYIPTQYYQQPMQQHPYQQQQQYVVQQQYITPQSQGAPMHQAYAQQHYTPGPPYNAHAQMHPGLSPAPGTHQIQTQPQQAQGYPPMQPPPSTFTPGQQTLNQLIQSPHQNPIRQSNTPIDRVETPSSSNSGTPTATKKKNRGGHSTGYILFASECHPRMRAENPSMPFGDISKLVGEEWRNQTDEKKREYEEKARELTAKAEAEGRPMQGKKKKKQQMRREMEEAAAAAQQQQQIKQQQQQQHPPPQPHVVIPPQQMAGQMVQQQYAQTQYHPGQYVPPQTGYQPGIPATPQHAIATPQYAGQTPQIVATPGMATPNPGQFVTPGQAYQTVSSAPQSAAVPPATSGLRRGPLFVKPPPKVQRVLHSEAYLRYIESLEKGNRTISNFEKTLIVKERDVQLSQTDANKLPVHWLGNGAGKHESAKAALWALRDLMLKDALAIKSHLLN